MSIFLDILRCILCCEDEEFRADLNSDDQSRFRNRDYYPIPYNDSTFTHSTSQSDTKTTARIYQHNHSNSSKSPYISSISSIKTPETTNKSSIPIVSFAKPKSAIDFGFESKNSILIKPENAPKTSDKSHEHHQKPKVLLLPPSSSPFPSLKPASTSSSSSSSFGSLPYFVKPTQSSTKPTPLSKPDKSSEVPQKPKILSSPPSPAYDFQTRTSSVINKETDQKLFQKPSPVSAQPSSSSSKRVQSLSKQPPSSTTTPVPSSKPSSSSSSDSFRTPPSSQKPVSFSTKPTLSSAPFNPTIQQKKTNYIWVEKGTSPTYAIPEDIISLLKKDIVPGVLKKPLSPLTYKDYFDALLYAEDYYLEKWDGFEMENITLELHNAAIHRRRRNYKNLIGIGEKDDEVFVAFEIDSIPERRPFLLSRDFASVRPSGRQVEPFQGLVYRVVKSNLVLVEFGEDFHSQHHSACKYDVKFSFNRVCLKRAHQALAAASDPLFRNFLFPVHVPINNRLSIQPYINHNLDNAQVSAVRQILGLRGPPPYLVEGQDSSRIQGIIQETVLQIYRTYSSCRILICAPLNRTCDVLMGSLMNKIPESDMFRANAAFRELEEVPSDILSSCLYEGECFSCPSLQELQKFKVVSSTFMSSFRLHNEGIVAGHFSHIFLVDASSATEPETLVALANLANETTSVIITGASRNRSGWIRSNIARKYGLLVSYFERLRGSKLYESLDPKLITTGIDRKAKLYL